MRKLTPLPLIVLLLLLAGCQNTQSPLQQVVTARDSYTATLAALNAAHRAGVLSVDEKRTIEPYRAAAAAALDSMEASALAGSTNDPFSDFSRAAKAFTAALDKLIESRLKTEHTKTAVDRVNATSQPIVEDAPIPSP